MAKYSYFFSPQRFISSPSIATWASFILRALPLIIFPPFIFRFFSPAEAALWFLLITLQGLQLLLESSIGLTFVRSIGYAMGGATQVLNQLKPANIPLVTSVNLELLSRIWLVMKFLYPVVGLITFILIGTMGFYSAPVIIDNIDNPYEGWVCLALFILGASLRAYGGLHISYLYGVGKISLLRWWEMIFWAGSVFAVVVTILLGGDLVVVTLAYQIPLLANLLWNVVLVKRDQESKINFIWLEKIDWGLFRDIWPGMWRATLGVVIYLGVTQGAGLYYAQIGSAQDVAVYLFAMSLMRPMMQFAQVPFMTKLPRLASLHAAGDKGALLVIVQRSMFQSNILLAAMIISVGAALPVIAWASGGIAGVPLILWALIGLASFVERVGAMHLQLYSQTNHIVWHWVNGGTGILFVIFAWLLLPYIDMLAIPAGLCLAILFFYMPYSMRYSYRAFGLRFPDFEMRTSLIPLLAVLSLFIVVLAW